MCKSPLRKQLESEIEALRRELNKEIQVNHTLTNTNVIALSQRLDQKIAEYQELKKKRPNHNQVIQ